MQPNFTFVLAGAIVFALAILGVIGWRFGWADVVAFVITTGLFAATLDFLSSFAARNYEYPGQTKLWVFTYIFFGWMGMCGCCMFIAEGILARQGQDMLTQRRLWWQVPLLTAIVAVVLDLYIDPVAVAAGVWIWSVRGTVYYNIPLLNFVGWFVLMLLAPLAWIAIARRRNWGLIRKAAVSFAALLPLMVAAIVLSLALNGLVALAGVR